MGSLHRLEDYRKNSTPEVPLLTCNNTGLTTIVWGLVGFSAVLITLGIAYIVAFVTRG